MNLKLRAGPGRLFVALAAAGLLAVACGSASQPPPVREPAAAPAAQVASAQPQPADTAPLANPANPEPAAKAMPGAAAAEPAPAEAAMPAAPAAQAEPVEPAGPEPVVPAAASAAPAEPAAPEPEPVVQAEPAAPVVPLPEVGTQVGYRIPDFTLELAEGGTVTAADLTAAGRPVFLFFFATI